MKGYVNLTHTNNGKIVELGDKIDNLTKNAQSDWEQTDESALDYIKNKPIIPEGSVLYPTTGQHTDGAMTQKAVTTELNRLSDNVSQLSNPNLLINGDFSINQRGETSYSTNNKYTVDRWNLLYGSLIVNNDGSVTHTSNNTCQGIRQYIEYPSRLAGKTVTLSCKCSSTGQKTIQLNRNSTNLGNINVPTSGDSVLSFSTTIPSDISDDDKLIVILYTPAAGQSITYYWAKLEIGSVATAFSPRPYAEELALCQRYYQKYSPTNSYSLIGTGIVFSTRVIAIGVSLPVTLRTSPTLTVNGDFYVRTTSATYTNDNALTLKPAGLCNNVLQIEITSANTSFTSGDCAVLRVSENTAYLEIDAEIYQ